MRPADKCLANNPVLSQARTLLLNDHEMAGGLGDRQLQMPGLSSTIRLSFRVCSHGPSRILGSVRGCRMVSGRWDGVGMQLQGPFIFPAGNTVVSLLHHLSQWRPLLRFIVLFLLAAACGKVKNVLFEAIKYKMEPNFSPG